ncbi:hypothetical protein [Rhodococcus koreensis]|uniref:hypothetical protein n=1 Tax=Rhodococcus koreensis TaxID=99653 RepID=UPI003672B735
MADITFDNDADGQADCTNYLIDNTRLRKEFDFTPRSAEECVEALLDRLRVENSRPMATATSV